MYIMINYVYIYICIDYIIYIYISCTIHSMYIILHIIGDKKLHHTHDTHTHIYIYIDTYV